MKSIKWQPKALKQLKKFKDAQVVARIYKAVGGLASFPVGGDIKALKNHKYDYRLRVGDYRVMFNVEESIEIVVVEEVKKRDERTY
ncbi:MAG: mRNA interferase RelE/StbE [Thiomicrorhabdus sp.]|nr:MAG: mRNA interferase RelE/StbE [Thiomicrorhabdus sp.]